MVTVWVDAWQQQCCGSPFAIDTSVRWDLTSPDRGWLEAVLGSEHAAEVDRAEEHHDRVPDAVLTDGRVRRIEAVYTRYAARQAGDPTRYPVPGAAVLTDRGDSQAPDRDDGDRQLVGYLVDLES